MDEPEEIFTVKEIAKICKISPQQVRHLINDGKLKAMNISHGKIRPVWKITRSELDKLLL